jgi:lipopolysaccharide export system protein LptC
MAERIAGPLSDAARADRRRLRVWARPGSSHDRIVALARIALPLMGLILMLALALAPVTSGREISFVLSKTHVSRAAERMRVTSALYRGQDDKGQAFALSAASAVQAHSADPTVKLKTLTARIGLPAGQATLTAPDGDYNTTNQKVALNGPVAFRSQDGYKIDTHDVDLDMKTRQLDSRTPVTGSLPLGRFSADHMTANLGDKTVVLTGNARLHIQQGSGKSAR